MKCLVCGKLHKEAECPRCRFPAVQFVGDRETELKKMEPFMKLYQENLRKSVRVEVPRYYWKDVDGALVEDRVEWVSIGTCQELLGKQTWLEGKFSRIPEAENVSVNVRIVMSDETREVNVAVPNILRPQLQELGAIVDENNDLRILLRCEGHAPTSSQRVALFA